MKSGKGSENLVGVIMAAGRGTRMSPFSSEIPKPLLPIANIPLIEHHIKLLSKIPVDEVIIVVGHLSHKIACQIGDGSSLGMKIRYVEQEEYLGIAHAVGKLEPYISSRFMLFLGDIFFINKGLRKMVKQMDSNACSGVLAVVDEPKLEMIKKNFAVVLENERRVKRVIEKPRYATNRMKGTGIYLFDCHIFDAIRRTPRTAMRNEYELTDSIQILIEDGFPVEISNAIEEDTNLTFPHDLLRCNIEYLLREGLASVVGENAQLNGAILEHSVIGKDVIVKHAITIRNSLILPDTIVKSRNNIDRCIISPTGITDCREFLNFPAPNDEEA